MPFGSGGNAVVSVNKNRVEQKRKTATQSSKLLKVLQDPNNFLSTIQVGITLVNILSGASLAETLSSRLALYWVAAPH